MKYNRELMGKTIMAMQRVQTVKEKREARFHANRMLDAKAEKKQQARADLEKHIELLAPAISQKEVVLRNVIDSAKARVAARKKLSKQAVRIDNNSKAVTSGIDAMDAN